MLPDYPEVKRLLSYHWRDRLVARIDLLMHGFAGMRRSVRFEGERTRIQTESSVEVSRPEKLEATSELRGGKRFNASRQEIDAMLDDLASQFASGQSRSIYQHVEKAATTVGNVVGLGGRALQPEDILRMMDKVEIDFDHDRRPRWPSLHFHPTQEPVVTTVFKRMWEEERYRTQFEALVNRKLGEWYAREANRSLD